MVLLEVVLAMALFAMSAGILLIGMNAATEALVRTRLQTHGSDLAHSVMAMLEAGILSPADGIDTGSQTAAWVPADWSWQVTTEPTQAAMADGSLVRVQVRVVHEPTGYSRRMVQWVPNRFASISADLSVPPQGAGGFE